MISSSVPDENSTPNMKKLLDESVVLEKIPAGENVVDDNTLLLDVMKLSSKYKEVILLYYYQDMKIPEIAEALQIPESTVSVRLKRGREKLKINLKGRFYDE